MIVLTLSPQGSALDLLRTRPLASDGRRMGLALMTDLNPSWSSQTLGSGRVFQSTERKMER
jgi:hypothetical protein